MNFWNRLLSTRGEELAQTSSAEDDQYRNHSLFDQQSDHSLVNLELSANDILNNDIREMKLLQQQAYEEKRRRLQNQTRGEQILNRLKYYVPILTWAPIYNLQKLKKDLSAGLTVGVLIVPQALAYATLAGLPPQVGLQTAFFPLIFYTLLGTSNQLSIGPEAIIAILLGISLDDFATTPEDRLYIYSIMTFMVGAFTLALGIFRFGFLADILSYPMLTGFLNAAAIDIILEQTDKFFGIKSKAHTWEKIPDIFKERSHVSWITLLIGLASLCFLLGVRSFKRRMATRPIGKYLFYIPESLVLVIITTIIISSSLNLSSKGVPIIGTIDAGILPPVMPPLNIRQLADLASSSLFIAVIGIIESSLIARTYSAKHKYRISMNRELVALGSANLFSSIFRTIPAFGSLPRSGINDAAGAVTPLATFFTSMIVLLTIYVLLPFFSHLPSVVMAAIIVVAASGLFNFQEISFLWQMRSYKDLGLVFIAFVSTVLFDAEFGIVITIMVSIFLIAKLTSKPYVAVLKKTEDREKFEETVILQEMSHFEGKHCWTENDGLLITRVLEDSLHFANARKLQELLLKLESMSAIPVKGLIINVEHLVEFDATSVIRLKDMLKDWNERGIWVGVVGLRNNHKDMFLKSGVIEILGIKRLFSDVPKAIEEYNKVYDSAKQRELLQEEAPSHAPLPVVSLQDEPSEEISL